MATPSLLSPLELCGHLEERGFAAWSQGEGLLEDLRVGRIGDLDARTATRSLLCVADIEKLLPVLPRAVITASRARRLTLATTAGPVDLFPVAHEKLEEVLLDFGLSPLAFAYRCVEKQWCDPSRARKKFESGLLDVTRGTRSGQAAGNPFSVAPRRYWITARLLSQYQLKPSAELLESARERLPEVLDELPQAAPARREISRILDSPDPAAGLAFLRDCGLSQTLFHGIKRDGASRIAKLPLDPALRWAAWLDGCAIQRAIVRLRMPHALARSIERIHRAHPIDRTIESLREGRSRKVLQRLGDTEIAGLIHWRRLELADAAQNEETRLRGKRLDEVEADLATIRQGQERSNQVRALALDGKSVMAALDAGPGPHVGRALAHLAKFVEANPESNEAEALNRELDTWAKRHFPIVRPEPSEKQPEKKVQ
ncbi:MAG: hypothetical protein H8E78_07725 [Proteobacteria bacterium]|nr:hypothetical protein [Pseudomonadota bacterium]